MPQPDQPAHWMSYSLFGSPDVLPRDRYCSMISVVLEAGAQSHFSGIRLIVVSRESEGLVEGLAIQECMYPKTCRWNPTTRHETHRHILSTIRSKQEKGRSLLREAQAGHACCVIVYELAVITWPTNRPRTYTNLIPLPKVDPSIPFRILYDHVHPIKQEPLLLFMHSSYSRPPNVNPQPAGPNCHMVRVLPISPDRPPFVQLPLPVLRRIAWHAFKSKHKGWRKELFALGTVCKAWVPLLDLFFGDPEIPLPQVQDDDPAGHASIFRSLTRTPSRGALMENYHAHRYWTINDMSSPEYLKSQSGILRLATSVKAVSIGPAPKGLVQDLTDALSHLREVRSLSISSRGLTHCKTLAQRLTIDDIQRCIVYWQHLTRLVVCDWETPKSLSSGSLLVRSLRSIRFKGHTKELAQSKEDQLASTLEYLVLDSGFLSRSQLLFFTSLAHPLSSLQRVNLHRITGLTNSDFLAFLRRVASSLEFLGVFSCEFPRVPGEEYALDAVMPDMTNLFSAALDGDLASELAISRKVHRGPLHGQTGKTRILLRCSPALEMAGIVKALDVSGWEAVDILWDRRRGVPPPGLVEAAARTARARGIRFYFSVDREEGFGCNMPG